MIGIISAVSGNAVIGIENRLPFNYPSDMKHFKETTYNSTVIMGRKTFESIGKPLPKRKNIIVSQNSNLFLHSDIDIATSLEEAISISPKDIDIWLIGGASIYEEGMNYADKIVLTITPDIELRSPSVKFPWINPLLFSLKEIVELDSVNKLKIATYEKIEIGS